MIIFKYMRKKPIKLLIVIFTLLLNCFFIYACSKVKIEGITEYEKYRPETQVNYVTSYSVSNGSNTKYIVEGLIKKLKIHRTDRLMLLSTVYGNDGRIYYSAHVQESNTNNISETYFCSVNNKGGDFKCHFSVDLTANQWDDERVSQHQAEYSGIIGIQEGNLIYLHTQKIDTTDSGYSTTLYIRNIKTQQVVFSQTVSGNWSGEAICRNGVIAFTILFEKLNVFVPLPDGSYDYQTEFIDYQTEPVFYTSHIKFVDIIDGVIIMSKANNYEDRIEWQKKHFYRGYDTTTGQLLNDVETQDIFAQGKKYDIKYKTFEEKRDNELRADGILSITKKENGGNISLTIYDLIDRCNFVRVLEETVKYKGTFNVRGAEIVTCIQADIYLYIILQRNDYAAFNTTYKYVCRLDFDKNEIKYAGKFLNEDEYAVIESNTFYFNNGANLTFDS